MFLTFLVVIDALELQCRTHYLGKCAKTCMVCEVEFLNVTDRNEIITNVDGFSGRKGATESDVSRISINNKVCNHIPANGEKFFSKLSTLRIWSSELKEVKQNDLKGFYHLQTLNLAGNELEILDSNLFAYNRKISQIDLSRNKLKHIGLVLLDPLKSLTSLKLQMNDCIDEGLKHNLESFKQKLRFKCPPTNEMIKNDIVMLSDENQRLRREIDDQQVEASVINCRREKFVSEETGRTTLNH